MQFVIDGPDIPDSLLQAHEEGRVVFFCGAGISYSAGLPGFKGLVDKIYKLIGTELEPIEREAYGRGQFDATLDLLEERLPGQRKQVRGVLAEALQPNLRRKGATDTHAALLQLAHGRDRALRLVTTNFDRIFERVAKRNKDAINHYAAPMLPIPKDTRWNGLVYIHGLLPDNTDISALNQLVLTSGDFGRAYLTERWAARFVSELFRNYTVCFVGYSINDQVLRYMMDALATDQRQGEVTPHAYAFADCPSGEEDDKTIEWKAKGVTPILYEVKGADDHSILHQTLKAWAETYRDGISGKERIVVDYAMARPSDSTQQDDFVGRMLWALSDASGLPAKRFAEFKPVPSLDWLKVFSEKRYRHGDLKRFKVSPNPKVDDELKFSLINRPAPYALAPRMMLAAEENAESQWDQVMIHLSEWLMNHLDDPALILWLTERGGQLHSRLVRMIEGQLDRFAELEHEGKSDELALIQAETPNAIHRPLLRPLWRLLLDGRVRSLHSWNIYKWDNRFKSEDLTTTLRLELREFLTPKIVLKKPFRLSEDKPETGTHESLKQLVDWELVLNVGQVYSTFHDLLDTERWRGALPALLDDFQQLLRDALDILGELGEADDLFDRSYLDLPSISRHHQNRGFREWVTLIELLRDAWLVVLKIDSVRATKIAKDWFAMPYPTFKRLALFAASQDNDILTDVWVNWLSTDDGRWLWSSCTRRETMRLLVLQGCNLTPQTQTRLEQVILFGPPRVMYKSDLTLEQWQDRVDHSVWLRLAKLQSSGAKLGSAADEKLAGLPDKYRKRWLADEEREEFSFWMSGTGDPDFEARRKIDHAPRKRKELVEWLKQPPPLHRYDYEDDWGETCRTRFFHCVCALSDLAAEGKWPDERWSQALYVWNEKGLVLRSWRFLAPVVHTMPNELLEKIAHSTTWWLESVSKYLDPHEDIDTILDLCRRILALQELVLQENDADTDYSIAQAINHPVGHIAEVFIKLCFRRKPNDNDKLPADLKPFFTQLCDTNIAQFRHARVLFASQLIGFFRIDRAWTKHHLLPLFDWETNPADASLAWEGFLWSPRLYWPLLIELKPQFLNTVNHYTKLKEHIRGQFVALLTHAGLEPMEPYISEDFRKAVGALPQLGLEEAARTLVDVLESAGEQSENCWNNRIKPFCQDIWPKLYKLKSQNITKYLAQISIAAEGEFPVALNVVWDWLEPMERPYSIVKSLHDAGLPKRFPENALRLLDAVVDSRWYPGYGILRECLTAISNAAPELQQDQRYKQLNQYLQR